MTITLPDVKDEKLNLTEDKLEFAGTSNGEEFKADLKVRPPSSLLHAAGCRVHLVVGSLLYYLASTNIDAFPLKYNERCSPPHPTSPVF